LYIFPLPGDLSIYVIHSYIKMQIPNRYHHSKKAQKVRLKPQAIRARKAALKALKRKLSAP